MLIDSNLGISSIDTGMLPRVSSITIYVGVEAVFSSVVDVSPSVFASSVLAVSVVFASSVLAVSVVFAVSSVLAVSVLAASVVVAPDAAAVSSRNLSNVVGLDAFDEAS